MSYYIVVREARADRGDEAASRELLRASVMSHVVAAFYLFLFQEITLQVTILLAAIMFIFVGLPIVWCAVTLPLVASLVWCLTYLTHTVKAAEVSQLRPSKQWVAEAYEPYFLSADVASLQYVVLEQHEESERIADCDRMRRKIVGTVSVRDFQGPTESIWMYGLAVDPRYWRRGVGRALAGAAVAWARQRRLHSVELATSDLQTEARLLFLQLGLEMRQMYHKQLLGAALTLTMFHQGLDLTQPGDDTLRS